MLHVAEEMTSLSRIIKSHWTQADQNTKKVIELKKVQKTVSDTESEEMSIIPAASEDIILNAEKTASSIIEDAQNHADQINRSLIEKQQYWETEKQQLAEESRRIGYQEGFNQGTMESKEQYSHFINEAKELVKLAKHDYQQTVQSAEKAILELSIKVAEKIISSQLNDTNDAYLTFVKNAMKEVREYEEIELHIHPNFYEFVLAQKQDLAKLLRGEKEFYIYPNEELNEHDCIIESSNGKLIAHVDQQLKEIKDKLLELLEEEIS